MTALDNLGYTYIFATDNTDIGELTSVKSCAFG